VLDGEVGAEDPGEFDQHFRQRSIDFVVTHELTVPSPAKSPSRPAHSR